VRISHQLAQRLETFDIQAPRVPRVQIIDPPLKFENSCPNSQPLPHLYYDTANPALSCLCLDDPMQPGWKDGASIAETIVPWTIDWLVCYEFWQATGRWVGGGRDHHVIAAESSCQAPQVVTRPWSLDPQEPYANGEYQGLGPRIESFAFSALTEAVYAAFSQRPCSPSWKSDFCLPASESISTLISSPELPQAA
jgi:hypothetical protein